MLPALDPLLGLSDLQAGISIGASVHEVAQVAAAGGIVSASAARNFFKPHKMPAAAARGTIA
ncbi:putative sulfate exporter family transporter [Arthrobacter sp. OV608]|uniref:putative sulfate exporter family transporter n=1 Tax=Arthrobacter sp. OV608 TaxID=1882768 RepID=UPI0011135757